MLNKPKELGYEFLFKYEQSINDCSQHILNLKNKIYDTIKNDKDIKERDVQGIILNHIL